MAQTTTKTAPRTSDRQVRAYQQAGEYLVFHDFDREDGFVVLKKDGSTYHTTLSSCDCPDAQRRGQCCKHVWLTRWHVEQEQAQAPAISARDEQRARIRKLMDQDFPVETY